MDLLSSNDRFPLETPGIKLMDTTERHEWNGPAGEKIIYRRLCLEDYGVENMSVLDGIVEWKGFKLDGEDVPFKRDLAEGLPYRIQARVRGGIRAADIDGGERESSVLYYRVPVISVIDRLRQRSTVRGKLNHMRYMSEMVRWALVDWDKVTTSIDNSADFNPGNVGKLPLEAVDLLWEKLLWWIEGEEEREERELKNSAPTSGD
ncbi:hypothetical protein ACFLT7_06020 [candidate division KSB1 bacterium]